MKQDNFFKNMFSKKDDVSSKRITGVFCVFVFAVLLTVAFFTRSQISEILRDLLKTLFFGGLALLGVAAIEKIWTK